MDPVPGGWRLWILWNLIFFKEKKSTKVLFRTCFFVTKKWNKKPCSERGRGSDMQAQVLYFQYITRVESVVGVIIPTKVRELKLAREFHTALLTSTFMREKAEIVLSIVGNSVFYHAGLHRHCWRVCYVGVMRL